MPTSLEDLTVDQLREHARGLQGDSELLRALAAHPDTREIMQRTVKKLNPNIPIPELDARDAVRTEIDATNKKVTTLENEIRERDIRDRLEKQRAGIMAKYKLSDADMLEVEKLMVDKDNPIPTYDAAARVFLASKQSATPTPSVFAPPTYEMPEKDVWGKGIGNKPMLDKIALNESFKALNDIVGGKVPGLGGARAA